MRVLFIPLIALLGLFLMTAFGCGSTDGDVVTTSDHVVLRYELELAKDPDAVICQPGDGVLRNVFPHIDIIDADITHISPDLGQFESPGFVNFPQFFRQWDDGPCEFTITTKIRNQTARIRHSHLTPALPRKIAAPVPPPSTRPSSRWFPLVNS